MINGDLFEFWFEWRTVVPRRGFRALAALMDVVDAGVPVDDDRRQPRLLGRRRAARDVGVDYQFGPWSGSLGGWRAQVEHGDGLRPKEDRGYRALRRVLRNPLAIRAFRWLHPDLASRLAMDSSHASRSTGARRRTRAARGGRVEPADAIRSLELLVFGHSHVATLERVPSGNVYANAGTWLDAPTFLAITPDRIALRQWDGSAESADLNAFDRPAKEALALAAGTAADRRRR